jgi:hypothetical protein
MSKLVPSLRLGQVRVILAATVALLICWAAPLQAVEPPADPGDALIPKEMKRYTQKIAGTDVDFDMVPIPGGQFVMGSPPGEKGHKPDEEPPGTNTICGPTPSTFSVASSRVRSPVRTTLSRMRSPGRPSLTRT